jgi:hypothetical protein
MSVILTSNLVPAFEFPASPRLRAAYMRRWGSCSPELLRFRARCNPQLLTDRRAWLLALADRIEEAGFPTFADVPAARFDEIAQLY